MLKLSFKIILLNLLLIGNIWALGMGHNKVKVYKVVSQDIYQQYSYPVVLEAIAESVLYSEISGFVDNIFVDIGQKIEHDHTIMQLRHVKPDYTGKPIKVTSPLTGEVVEIYVKQGSQIKIGDKLVHILDPYNLRLSMQVPEREKSLIKIGQTGQADFKIADLAIVVTGVAANVDSKTGTVTAKLAWKDKATYNKSAGLMLPGMVGVVKFKVEQRTGIAVPIAAIVFEKQKPTVRLVVDNKIKKQVITLGKNLGTGYHEVTNGLAVGDLVVTNKGKYLKTGEEVIVEK